jgi:hypothetical protein
VPGLLLFSAPCQYSGLLNKLRAPKESLWPRSTDGPMNMEKFCVFCGDPPKKKNKEHVLPRWLIGLTGDPKRVGHFGIDFTKKQIGVRQFAFDSLTFPACYDCNSAFGILEAAAEKVVRKLLSHQTVSTPDLMLFLDWLDKVRVGMWLAFFYLDKNFAGIKPRFHIIQRLGMYDRMVGIVRLEDSTPRLTFSGTDSKFYQFSPTCLGLGISGFYFISASGMSLCSQRLGFPYLRPESIREKDHNMLISREAGSGRAMYPVERIPSPHGMTLIYQPVFRMFLEADDAEQYLANDWVKKHTADFERGFSKLFLQRNDSVHVYPDGASLDWLPTQAWKTWELVSRLPAHIYGRLRRDFEGAIGLYSSKEDRKHLRKQAMMARMMDNAMLKRINERAAHLRAKDK